METNQQPPLRSMAGANSQLEEEGRYKPDPLNDYLTSFYLFILRANLPFRASTFFLPPNREAG